MGNVACGLACWDFMSFYITSITKQLAHSHMVARCSFSYILFKVHETHGTGLLGNPSLCSTCNTQSLCFLELVKHRSLCWCSSPSVSHRHPATVERRTAQVSSHRSFRSIPASAIWPNLSQREPCLLQIAGFWSS